MLADEIGVTFSSAQLLPLHLTAPATPCRPGLLSGTRDRVPLPAAGAEGVSISLGAGFASAQVVQKPFSISVGTVELLR
jgi:hypothetical protein